MGFPQLDRRSFDMKIGDSRDIAEEEVLQKGEPFRDALDCFGI